MALSIFLRGQIGHAEEREHVQKERTRKKNGFPDLKRRAVDAAAGAFVLHLPEPNGTAALDSPARPPTQARTAGPGTEYTTVRI